MPSSSADRGVGEEVAALGREQGSKVVDLAFGSVLRRTEPQLGLHELRPRRCEDRP
jgi:hypothetical protein